MITDSQREKFSRILDLNWDCNRASDPQEKARLKQELEVAQKDLESDMGKDAYNRFMTAGRLMFSWAAATVRFQKLDLYLTYLAPIIQLSWTILMLLCLVSNNILFVNKLESY